MSKYPKKKLAQLVLQQCVVNEIEKVAQADLFVRLGLEGLEPWVQSVLDVNPGVNVLELVNSSMIEFDDIINSNNPHVWMNPNNVKTMIEAMENP